MRRREEEARRNKELDRMHQLLTLSRMHYQRSNLVYRGMLPWISLHQAFRVKWRKAETFHRDSCIASVWQAWQEVVRRRRIEREQQRLLQVSDGVTGRSRHLEQSALLIMIRLSPLPHRKRWQKQNTGIHYTVDASNQ